MDRAEVKVGIYNAHWSTFGGGEQQAGGIADALSAEHSVELIGPDPIDLEELRERLGLRLDGVVFRTVFGGDYGASMASADYDLFVNHTYRSVAPCLAPTGIYFVMFPHRFEESSNVRRARVAGRRIALPVRFLSGVGRDQRTRQRVVLAPSLLQVAADVRSLSIELGVDGLAVTDVDVDVAMVKNGSSVTRHRVGDSLMLDFALAGRVTGQVLISPVMTSESEDDRTPIRVLSVRADDHVVDVGAHPFRERLVKPDQVAFLSTYRSVVALSEYTLGWTRAWWGRGDTVVFPPVAMRRAGEKANLIVSVGRFFGEDSGHSKRQLELVRAFRMLVEGGLRNWQLVLIGGCNPADRSYAMAVRRAAEGLPVEVRISAPGAVLDEHLAAASIYWHAAGLGSDLSLQPDRGEHFGIAPIEAMSAGAVPVVFGAAGPAEVVQHEVNGLHFRDIDELVTHTLRLINDAPLRARLAAAAVERAQQFDRAHFESSVRALVSGLADDAPRVSAV